MPEGPSILHLRNQLKPFIGKIVKNAGGYGPMETDWIKGKKLLDITVHGKYLFFHFNNGIVQLHLGLFGSIVIDDRKNVNRKFFMEFAKGEINGYIVNVKKLANIAEAGVDERTDILSSGFDAAYVKSLIKEKPKAQIEAILMDQDIFSGVGNKIRNEALHKAGIHPESVVEKIPAAKITALIKAVVANAKLFYKNLESKGKHADFEVYKSDFDPKGSEVHMKVLKKSNRKIYFTDSQVLYK